MIKIGKLVLHHPHEGKIWINDTATGEGAEFEVSELRVLLEAFWKERV